MSPRPRRISDRTPIQRAAAERGSLLGYDTNLPRRRATYQDVLDAPAHRVAEIVDGTLYTQPRPAMPHALASSYLGDELVGPFGKGRGGPGGWWIIDEPELHFDEDILVPDLAGWRRERMPDYPDAAYFNLAPDSAGSKTAPGQGVLAVETGRERWRARLDSNQRPSV